MALLKTCIRGTTRAPHGRGKKRMSAARPRGAQHSSTLSLFHAGHELRAGYLDVDRIAVKPEIRPGRHVVSRVLHAADDWQVIGATVDRRAARCICRAV